MLYNKKSFVLAVCAAQLAQGFECMDTWSTARCARQKKKGNCVAEAKCPNPKKGGIKCARASAKCQATCGKCLADDECAMLVANLTAELEICTAEPTPTPTPMPIGVGSAGCPLQALATTADGVQWCAENCPDLAVHVISDGQDFSSNAEGVCVVMDATAVAFPNSVDLTQHADCLVVAGEYPSNAFLGPKDPHVKGNGGDDLMCAGPGDDGYWYGGDGNDTLYAGPGDDESFYGNAGDDSLFGGDGDDQYFYGNEGVDTLFGGDGVDPFYGGDSPDVMYGIEI